MEREKLNKKQIIPLIVGVLTLVVLVASATYAYFSVTAGNTSGTTTITGDIGGGTLGTVTLSGGGTELYLGLSAYDMSQTESGKTYYSSTTEGSRETNVNSAGKATYTATLSGDESDSVMYACDYEFTVTSSGSALESEHISDISVVFEGDINKTVALSSSQTVKGTWFGFKNSNKEREFNAYLQLNNTESEQNDLAGTNLSVEISNTKWNCYLSELDELVGEAYAILTENGKTNWNDDAYYDLTFVRSETPIKVGDTYNGVEITAVYTGFEEETYTYNTIPWKNYWEDLISSIVFEDEIRPISIANWIPYMEEAYIDVTNLNTSLVTDMSYMFSGVYYIDEFIGIENWDVSNVTNMSWMFGGVTVRNLDLSKWDVSNVTNMSGMFEVPADGMGTINVTGWNTSKVTNMSGMFGGGMPVDQIIGLETWDTSNVTTMAEMFMNDTIDFDLSGWNTSNVTNMSNMFYGAKINADIDLSKWDTSKVTNMSFMFCGATINKVGNISNWNTGNVTNMEVMFADATINTDMDLSGWDVSNVRYYEEFNDRVSGTGTLTPPNWNTTNE